MEAYSPETNTTYPSWEALVEDEANGWVAVAVVSNGRQTWPWVVGPFPTKREANNARVRLRRESKRKSLSPKYSASFFVRPAWRDPR